MPCFNSLLLKYIVLSNTLKEFLTITTLSTPKLYTFFDDISILPSFVIFLNSILFKKLWL